MPATKRCSRPECGREYEATTENFAPDKRRRDGLTSQCRSCTRDAVRKHYAANTERVYEAHRRYRETAEGSKVTREAYRRYHNKNSAARREAARDHMRRYRATPEWRAWHREYVRARSENLRANCAIRRARTRSQGTPTTAEERAAVRDVFEWARHAEAFTGRKFAVDHITPLSRGGTSLADNLQHLPLGLNAAKGAKTHEEALATVPGYAEWFRPLVWEPPSFTIIPKSTST